MLSSWRVPLICWTVLSLCPHIVVASLSPAEHSAAQGLPRALWPESALSYTWYTNTHMIIINPWCLQRPNQPESYKWRKIYEKIWKELKKDVCSHLSMSLLRPSISSLSFPSLSCRACSCRSRATVSLDVSEICRSHWLFRSTMALCNLKIGPLILLD